MAFANSSPSRLERIYLQQESEFGVLPNIAGNATLSGADACRHIHCGLQATVKTIQRPDKTGFRRAASGQAGKMGGQWKLEMSLAPNGVAGQKPDCDALLAAVMGQNATVVTGTATITAASNTSPISVTAVNSFSEFDVISISGVTGAAGAGMNGIWTITDVTPTSFTLLGSTPSSAYTSGGTVTRSGVKYELSDEMMSFALWRFRQPSSLQQMAGIGCVVKSAQFQLGQDVARWHAEGDAKWVLDSIEAPYADSTQLAGLTTFPNEPGSPVTNGGMIVGFQGSAVMDGYPIATLRSATIEIAPNVMLPQDYFGSNFGEEPEAGLRTVAVEFEMRDDDGLALQGLYNRALTKTPIDLVFRVGSTIGSTVVFVLRGVQLDVPVLEDGERTFSRKFGASLAHGSDGPTADEIAIWMV